MAQAMHIDATTATSSMDKKTYSVDFKGLIAHLVDILFIKDDAEKTYYSNNLSIHMQKDLGLYR